MQKTKHITTLLLLIFSISLTSCQHTNPNSQNHTWQEAFKALGISWNPNGTLSREIQIPEVDPTPDSTSTSATLTALSTDISISSTTKAYVRLFIPLNPPKDKKLPLIIYLHGGDFVLFSASTVIFHNFCNDVASQLRAVVASVEYRLAPENRLPAAYDDGLNGVFWARDQALGKGGRHPWVFFFSYYWMEYADFSKVFLMGSSAGANIVYHVALRALDFDVSPLKIKGLLLNQAYFGGVKRTQSEIRLKDDPFVALDHAFCNPISGGTYMGRVFRLPKVYIKSDYGDPLVDRSVKLAKFLHSCRVPVYYRFNEGGYHEIEFSNRTAAQELYNDMKYFVNNVCENENERIGDNQALYSDMNYVMSSVLEKTHETKSSYYASA